MNKNGLNKCSLSKYNSEALRSYRNEDKVVRQVLPMLSLIILGTCIKELMMIGPQWEFVHKESMALQKTFTLAFQLKQKRINTKS